MTPKDDGSKAKPGPKPDTRPHVTFKVERAVYERLAGLQPETGQTPDLLASLVLHMVVNDPANAFYRLNALLGSPHPDGESELRSIPAPRKGTAG